MCWTFKYSSVLAQRCVCFFLYWHPFGLCYKDTPKKSPRHLSCPFREAEFLFQASGWPGASVGSAATSHDSADGAGDHCGSMSSPRGHGQKMLGVGRDASLCWCFGLMVWSVLDKYNVFWFLKATTTMARMSCDDKLVSTTFWLPFEGTRVVHGRFGARPLGNGATHGFVDPKRVATHAFTNLLSGLGRRLLQTCLLPSGIRGVS